MKYINKDVFNNKVIFKNRMYGIFNLLIIVCEFGYYNIVVELLKYGVDVNFCFDYEIFLIVVLGFGYLKIV